MNVAARQQDGLFNLPAKTEIKSKLFFFFHAKKITKILNNRTALLVVKEIVV